MSIPNRRITSNINTFRDAISVEQFLSIEDNDLKKFIYHEGLVRVRSYMKQVNNDEKIGYYYLSSRIQKNTQNVFYKKTFLMSWIVYNRKTKKVSMSAKNDGVEALFLKDHLKSDTIDIAKRFIRKLTPTLCKKLVEGKITTISDLVAYNKSYVLRKKHLSLRTIYNFMIIEKEGLFNEIENPEELEDLKQISVGRVTLGAFTYKLGTDIKEKYNEWYRKQGEKYDIFLR